MNSRFWLFRKYLNQLSTKDYKDEDQNIPFFAWQCISIQCKDRDVDLIIKKDSKMMMLINYINYKIGSIDGTRGTALRMANLLYQSILDRYTLPACLDI